MRPRGSGVDGGPPGSRDASGPPAPAGAEAAAADPGDSAEREEGLLMADPRLAPSVASFNAGEWYACHDGFEELWHQTQGPMRPVLQGILQIAVAHLHLERGNLRGATVLLGEGLGRLRDVGDQALGLRLDVLREAAGARLRALQEGASPQDLPLPRLLEVSADTG